MKLVIFLLLKMVVDTKISFTIDYFFINISFTIDYFFITIVFDIVLFLKKLKKVN